jgi:hypothetical protein
VFYGENKVITEMVGVVFSFERKIKMYAEEIDVKDIKLVISLNRGVC